MNMSKIDMTQGSILGRAAQFALPICIGNILQQLYGTVDTLVIGNFCDASALAAVATSSQPLEILLCIFLGIGSGISILISQANQGRQVPPMPINCVSLHKPQCFFCTLPVCRLRC